MRNLVLLRGAPASGKSTWIEKNKLESYTLSTDKIRLMCQSPVLDIQGNNCISQQNDSMVWDMLMEMLEDRMSRGEFVVIDATHYKSELINKYKKLLVKYRYRGFIVDFTDVPKEELIRRNSERDEYKRVPEFVIDKMCAVFDLDTEVSNKFKVVNRDKFLPDMNRSLLYDFNKYEKVITFGDVHGCYEPLKSYFERNPMRDDYMYIFTGDYVDRGLQNKEVVEFLLTIMEKDNVLLLEGNHERWIRLYADEEGAELDIPKEDIKVLKKYLSKNKVYRIGRFKITSGIFKKDTIPQLESFNKGDLRKLCRKLGQFAFFKFGDKEYLISHGGIPCIPTVFTATEELIKGTGRYEDLEDIYTAWHANTGANQILIHAHRNLCETYQTEVNNRIYNLCAEVEFGSPMRIIEIAKDGINVVSEENPVFAEKKHKVITTMSLETLTGNEVLEQLNSSRDVIKKLLEDDVVSYNFSRKVFTKRTWNALNCRARGLFVDSITGEVVARSYTKFYNWAERDETKSVALKDTLEFPVMAWKKENGFLGIVSYHNRVDKLFVASKSTNIGDYADMVREQVANIDQKKLTAFLKENNVTLIFEVINVDKDPHIIKYPRNQIVLLDIVENKFEDSYASPEDLLRASMALGVPLKTPEYLFHKWEDLYNWKHEQDKSYDVRHEGWVLEDNKNFRVKYKTRFYKFWKMMRSIKEKMQKGTPVNKTWSTEEEVRVYNIMNSISPEDLAEMSIIDIEEIFYHPEALLLGYKIDKI